MRSRALNLAVLALLVSLCGWAGGDVRPAAAQALDAGKPPAQIFSGTCSACHRSPRGLVRNVSAGSLPGFLRQHYTTGNEMAGVMAAYVLGNGGTERVAEPPQPKREPKQKAKSDGQDVAAHTPDAKEQSKASKQKAGKKGQPEPAAKDTSAPAAKDMPAAREPEKTEPAKQETATSEPPKADAAAVECKVEPQPKPTVAAADEAKPPRQPTALLTLPGFPAPEPEAEPEPEPAATATAPPPDCEPKAATTAASVTAPAEPAPKEPQQEPQPSTASAPAPTAAAETPKVEPLRPAVAETVAATPDIMQEEVHAPRPRIGGQKKRAQ